MSCLGIAVWDHPGYEHGLKTMGTKHVSVPTAFTTKLSQKEQFQKKKLKVRGRDRLIYRPHPESSLSYVRRLFNVQRCVRNLVLVAVGATDFTSEMTDLATRTKHLSNGTQDIPDSEDSAKLQASSL